MPSKQKQKSKPRKKDEVFRVGVDLGGTKMLALVFDKSYKVIGREKKKTKATKSSKALFSDITSTIKSALEDADINKNALQGIGIGVPGPVEFEKGNIIFTPNLPFKDFAMKSKLSKVFGAPVTVDNDVNVGLLAELHFGAAENKKHVLGVFPGTGIGGGLIINGKVFRGASGAAGEIGHTLVDPDGPMCGCGRRGCLEAIVGRPAIASQAAVMAMRGSAPYLADNVGTDPADIRSGALARSIKAGDKAIKELLTHSARLLGRGLSGILNTLSPDTIVLGGGLVEALPDIFLKEVGKGVKESVVPCIAQKISIVVAECGDNAVAMGAAKLVDEVL